MPVDNIHCVLLACIIKDRVSSQLESIYLAFAHIYDLCFCNISYTKHRVFVVFFSYCKTHRNFIRYNVKLQGFFSTATA